MSSPADPIPDYPSLHVPKPTAPHGWVQWKGTDVCMDVHCACGELVHVDGEFAYFVRCVKCGQKYEVGGYVVLYPVPENHPTATNALDAC